DVVIAASRFTRDSFARAGLDTAKVRIVPYGAPPPAAVSEALRFRPRGDRPLELIWAGTFGIRKGAHYLLDAWRSAGLGRRARLTVCGSVAVPARLLSPAPEGISFAGALARADLRERFAA